MENIDRNYKNLFVTMTDARNPGIVDWIHIEDRTRVRETFPSCETPGQAIELMAEYYSEDIWLVVCVN